jgi:predicted RNase H-like HicB family nuclease
MATMKEEFTVTAEWDSEAAVWVAESKDMPGLVTEAENLEALVAKLRTLIPELLEAQRSPTTDGRRVSVQIDRPRPRSPTRGLMADYAPKVRQLETSIYRSFRRGCGRKVTARRGRGPVAGFSVGGGRRLG